MFLGIARGPWSHHETFQVLLRNVAAAHAYQAAYDIVAVHLAVAALPPNPVRAAGHLLESRLVKIVESLDNAAALRLLGHLRQFETVARLVVIPVALEDALRAARVVFRMVPPEIAPGPGAHGILFAGLDDMEKIIPPEFALAHGDVQATAGIVLMPGCLLVETYVHETGITEYLGDILDEILAHPVVRRRREHAAIMLQPSVVRCGEIELGDHLDALCVEMAYLVPHPVWRPAALDGKFGMARENKPFAYVDDEHVEPLGGHMVGNLAPIFILGAKLRVW